MTAASLARFDVAANKAARALFPREVTIGAHTCEFACSAIRSTREPDESGALVTLDTVSVSIPRVWAARRSLTLARGTQLTVGDGNPFVIRELVDDAAQPDLLARCYRL